MDQQQSPVQDPAAGNRFERHPRLTMAIVLVAFTVLLVSLMEWLLAPAGDRHFGTAGFKSPVPERAIVLREWQRNTDYQMAAPPERFQDSSGDVEKVYTLSTDAHAFIEPSLRHPEPDLTIAFLGGSTTECLYVRPQNRFPALAAALLEKETGRKVNGINAGRSGNSTVHSVLTFIAKVARQQPDYVVLMHGVNDIGLLSSHGGYWTDHPAFHIVQEAPSASVGGALRMLGDSLIPNTKRTVRRAGRTIRNGFGALFGGAQAAEGRKQEAPAAPRRDWQTHGRQFERALTSFVATARAWGATPVLMTQVNIASQHEAAPGKTFLSRQHLSAGSLDATSFNNKHAYFNQIIRNLAAREDALLIDLASAREWQAGDDIYDAIHFTDAGSRRVAEIVAAHLLRALKTKAAGNKH
jgi:lysophospholipase L1-like esterase